MKSRRGLFKVLAGAALGAAGLIDRSPERAEAAKRCPHGKERCGGQCRATCTDVKVRNRATCHCECPDGMKSCGTNCVGKDICCPGEKDCGGGCISEDSCCPYTPKECPDGSCLKKGTGACCPGVEEACPTDPEGCCNTLAGQECSTSGCCNTLVGSSICNGACVDTDTDRNNCGACGTTCGPCQVCQGGECRSICQPGYECCAGSCCPTGSC